MKTTSSRILTLIITFLPLGFLVGYTAMAKIKMDQSCSSYLKTASNANTVPLALDQLNTAVSYMEKQHLTSGYTSILYKTQDENIGFFYQNLKASQNELENLSKKPDLTALEQSNALLKLRDTLTDHEEGHETITMPNGLSLYPHNTGVVLWLVLSVVVAAVGWFLAIDPQ